MKNKLIMWIVRWLTRFLDKPNHKDVGPRLRYLHQGFESNYVNGVEYPLSYVLSCHESNRQVSFLVGKDQLFSVKINLNE